TILGVDAHDATDLEIEPGPTKPLHGPADHRVSTATAGVVLQTRPRSHHRSASPAGYRRRSPAHAAEPGGGDRPCSAYERRSVGRARAQYEFAHSHLS